RGCLTSVTYGPTCPWFRVALTPGADWPSTHSYATRRQAVLTFTVTFPSANVHSCASQNGNRSSCCCWQRLTLPRASWTWPKAHHSGTRAATTWPTRAYGPHIPQPLYPPTNPPT